MGLNLLNFSFRVERAFKVRVPQSWYVDAWDAAEHGKDVTLEQFHAFLLRLCVEQNVAPPQDGMAILIREVEAATGRSFAELGRQTMLRRDIGPDG